MRMLEEHFRYIGHGVLTKEKVVAADISSAARWFHEDSGKRYWDMKNDFPIVVPPWKFTWMEYKFPGHIGASSTSRASLSQTPIGQRLVAILAEKTPPAPDRIGSFFYVHRIEEKDSHTALEDDALYDYVMKDLNGQNDMEILGSIGTIQDRRRKAIIKLIADSPDAGLGWLVVGGHFVTRGRVINQTMRFGFCIDTKGGYIPSLDMFFYSKPPLLSRDEFVALMANEANTLSVIILAPFLFAISLLHCKNVTLEDIPVPPKVRKAREKKGIPSITYKTLVVNPLRAQVRRERDEDTAGEQNTVKRALHIVRGHFADYTQGGGLFGKYHGVYWLPMHVRGSAEAGEIHKDYRLTVG